MSHNHTLRLYLKDETKWHCAIKNCLNNSTHECCYDFTNRHGRDVTVRVPRCREHAQVFSQKHDARHINNIGAEQ